MFVVEVGIAAREPEAETGHSVLQIRHLFDFARSRRMTTEIARCFVVCFAEEQHAQQLDDDEEISVCYVEADASSTVAENAFANGDLLNSSVLLCGPWLWQRMTLMQQDVEHHPEMTEVMSSSI